MMLDLIFGLIKWFRQLWDRLDEKTKRLIIEVTVEAYKELLRAFYRWWKSRKKK